MFINWKVLAGKKAVIGIVNMPHASKNLSLVFNNCRPKCIFTFSDLPFVEIEVITSTTISARMGRPSAKAATAESLFRWDGTALNRSEWLKSDVGFAAKGSKQRTPPKKIIKTWIKLLFMCAQQRITDDIGSRSILQNCLLNVDCSRFKSQSEDKQLGKSPFSLSNSKPTRIVLPLGIIEFWEMRDQPVHSGNFGCVYIAARSYVHSVSLH